MGKKSMVNKNLQAKRERSWARGQARKVRNEEANRERMKANTEELAALGGTRQSYERVVERRIVNSKTGVVEMKTYSRTKLESPGSALARTRRGQRS